MTTQDNTMTHAKHIERQHTGGNAPENYFRIPGDTPPVIDTDVVCVSLTRARAIISLLESDGEDLETGFRLPHAVILNALDCINGHLVNAEQAIHHSFNSVSDAINKGE